MGKKKKLEPVDVGCDLGNTYSTVAVGLGGGRVEYLRDANGDVAIPSLVFRGKDGKVYVGVTAKNAALADPQSCFGFFKRLMREIGKGGQDPVLVIDGDHAYTAEDIASVFLQPLMEKFEAQLGREIRDGVFTVPGNYGDLAKTRTRQAALRAGIGRVRLLEEPVAACLAYSLDRGADGTILVFDLGGGTFDTTIVRVEDGVFRQLVTQGIESMGGIDMTNRVVDRIVAEYEAKAGGKLNLAGDASLRAKLTDAAEAAKIRISTFPETQVTVVVRGREVSFQLTRTDFEVMIKPMVETMENALSEVVAKAALNMSELDHVVLVGGGTKVPAVREMVEKVTGKKPSVDIDPATAVAHGAALFALVCDFDEASQENLDHAPTGDPVKDEARREVKDFITVSPHALGVEALRDGKPVLSEVYGSDQPVGKTITKQYGVTSAGFGLAKINVYQGKDGAPPDQCFFLGSFDLEVVGLADGGKQVTVEFSYTKDGLVRVSAKDEVGGKAGSREIRLEGRQGGR